MEEDQKDQEDQVHDHEPYLEVPHISPTRKIINYFEIAATLASGVVPNTICPHRFFASSTTALFLAIKLSLRVSIDEATDIYSLPDLQSVITNYFSQVGHLVEPAEKMQV